MNSRSLGAIRTFIRTEKARRIGFLTAAVAFISGLYLSLQSASFEDVRLMWGYLLFLVLVGAPTSLALNGWIFWVSTRAVGGHCSYCAALRLTILSSAANALPLPGGAIVRVAALKEFGAQYGAAMYITAAAALYWLAVALVVAGLGLQHYSGNTAYLMLGLAGLVMAMIAASITWLVSKSFSTILWLGALSILTHAAASVRFWLAFYAINVPLAVIAATVVAASGTAGAVIGFVPGGLGVNEAMAALLAQLAGISSALGFLAAVVNRLANYIVLSPLSVAFLLQRGGRETTSS